MQLSNKIYNLLLEANKRGVESIIIYRENKLSENQKERLKAIDNLNLMHHPNIHAKCFYNENYLLIGSMNLYEYSEINNREMGVLFHKKHISEFKDDGWRSNYDSDEVFDEALEEIIEIKNGAELERPSKETVEEGFEIEILKNKKEKKEEYLKKLNAVLLHKKFILNDEEVFICKSYMDKVDVILGHKTEFLLKYDEKKLNYLFQRNKGKVKENEFAIPGFKMYWNKAETLLLYQDSKHTLWNSCTSEIDEIHLKMKGINEMILFIKGL